MTSEWKVAKLEDLCQLRGGIAFKPSLQGRSTGDVPFVKVSDMNLPENAVQLQEANNWISEEDLLTLRAKPLPPGTVVFAKIGEALRQNRLRQVARRTVIDNNMMGAVPFVDIVDARFLYYALSQFDFSQIAQGTALPYLTVTSLSGLTLKVPPLSEQRAIAHVLETLDHKIELNRRMSETLEGIAATVFHSWFVAFDGAEHLEISDLGLIPEGWRFEPIGNLIEVVGGSTPSTKEPSYWEGGYLPWATPKDLSGHEGPVLLKTARSITDAGLERISSGLLPKGTLLFSSRAPIGYRALAGQPMAVNQGFIAVPPGGELSPTYMYFWTHSNLDVIKGHAGGSTFAEISKRSFRTIPAVLPPMELRHRFDEVAGAILRRCEILARESETLAELRDALLPKLISGELRISEAEQLVGEVA